MSAREAAIWTLLSGLATGMIPAEDVPATRDRLERLFRMSDPEYDEHLSRQRSFPAWCDPL